MNGWDGNTSNQAYVSAQIPSPPSPGRGPTAPQRCFSRLFPAPAIPFSCTFSRGYSVFGRIHMIDLRFGRPTHPSTKIFCLNPSIYQNFLHKVKSRCQFLLSNPSIYQNFSLKVSQGANFCFEAHPSTKFHTLLEKIPTHLSTSAF